MSTFSSNDVLRPCQLAFIAERFPEAPSTAIYPRLIAMRSVIDLPDALTGSLAGTLTAFWHPHHPRLPLCSSLAHKPYKMGRERHHTGRPPAHREAHRLNDAAAGRLADGSSRGPAGEVGRLLAVYVAL